MSNIPTQGQTTISVPVSFGVVAEFEADDEDSYNRLSRSAERFMKQFPDPERRILITVSNNIFQMKASMTISRICGDLCDGLWDYFLPNGSKTIAYYVDEIEESGELTNVRYVVGISHKIPEDRLEELKEKLNYFKLTSRSN